MLTTVIICIHVAMSVFAWKGKLCHVYNSFGLYFDSKLLPAAWVFSHVQYAVMLVGKPVNEMPSGLRSQKPNFNAFEKFTFNLGLLVCYIYYIQCRNQPSDDKGDPGKTLKRNCFQTQTKANCIQLLY